MRPHVCPWWGGYFIDNRFRRLLHRPETILSTYVQPGSTVLDFGCGMGFFSIPMARWVGRQGCVIAADLQAEMLQVLRRRAAKAGVANRIRTHRCQSDSVGIDQPIDFALAFYSAHEVPEPRRLFREIHQSLRSEAKLLIVEPVGHVSADDFQKMMSIAEGLGFWRQKGPPVRLSRTALLVK